MVYIFGALLKLLYKGSTSLHVNSLIPKKKDDELFLQEIYYQFLEWQQEKDC